MMMNELPKEIWVVAQHFSRTSRNMEDFFYQESDAWERYYELRKEALAEKVPWSGSDIKTRIASISLMMKVKSWRS
jgi:hypothetical protein